METKTTDLITIKNKWMNKLIILGLVLACFVGAIFLGAMWMENSILLKQLEADTQEMVNLRDRCVKLEEKADGIEAYARRIERQYTTFVIWAKTDFGPEKVEKSMEKMKEYTGIGGSDE